MIAHDRRSSPLRKCLTGEEDRAYRLTRARTQIAGRRVSMARIRSDRHPVSAAGGLEEKFTRRVEALLEAGAR